jgi:hypothetical protein
MSLSIFFIAARKLSKKGAGGGFRLQVAGGQGSGRKSQVASRR